MARLRKRSRRRRRRARRLKYIRISRGGTRV